MSRETSTVVTCARSTPTVGEDTTCSATVTDTSPGMINTPAGNLTFTPIGICALTGTGASASCSTNIATTAVGTLSISATYLGDSNHNASSGITTIIVFPLPPPPLVADLAFSPNSPVTGQTVNFTATVTGGSPPYTYSWSFGDGTTDSGNPASHTYENANTYSVVLIVTDANGTTFSDTKLLAVKITPNPPIILTVPSNQSIDHGSNLRFNVTAVEDSPQQISISCVSCPSLGADFTSNSGPGAAYGTFSWTPTEAQAPGVYFVVLSSTDGSQIVNATVAITVNEDNTPPTLHVPGTLTVRDGETLQFVVNATDSNAPPENLTLTATGLPDGASFDPVTGVFYWPIQGVQPGPYTLTFTAMDSGTPPLQDSQTVVVHVNNGNGRCFICEMFLESQLAVNPSPLVLILRAMVALMGFLGVIAMKYLKDHGRERFKHTVQHSGHVENAS
ncbi:PKD domain-containing protein [Candidatus Bathyarchaeota archaeon]|nr:MAG: PKD domain-containing protein [Candidatus Bathyarchaeota archaeon]